MNNSFIKIIHKISSTSLITIRKAIKVPSYNSDKLYIVFQITMYFLGTANYDFHSILCIVMYLMLESLISDKK